MNVRTSLDELAAVAEPRHLAIGVFDGLHLGHRAVIGRALAAARDDGGTAAMVTFDPHPARVLRPETAPLLLTHTAHKLALAAELGVREAVVVAFDAAFCRLAAADFARALTRACGTGGSVAVGRDWRFGHRAIGDVELLRAHGLAVAAVDPVCVNGETISSTLVREAVAAGSLDRAALFLGRAHSVLGTVMEGRKLARQLGFPTANVAVANEQLPPNGVYAVRARWAAGGWHPGVANLGVRPTVEENGGRLLEVHLFDRDASLYGQSMEVRFEAFLRPEQVFTGLEALKEQIARDSAAARAALGM